MALSVLIPFFYSSFCLVPFSVRDAQLPGPLRPAQKARCELEYHRVNISETENWKARSEHGNMHV